MHAHTNSLSHAHTLTHARTHTHCHVWPQENGNKLDTRWMSLTDAAARVGTLIVALQGDGGGIPALSRDDATRGLPALSEPCQGCTIILCASSGVCNVCVSHRSAGAVNAMPPL